ncbi:hypothetical protein [Amycolatopsis sp.]|uniref:hypothetical protein n=1 Tax=Amycolatopsis sp. TaxID=37632 RepID=UPI002D809DB5|nr:hypothetical protein [Amycolatopsis sp.]
MELFSAEGLRRPVVRRLGRMVSFGLGEGGYRLVGSGEPAHRVGVLRQRVAAGWAVTGLLQAGPKAAIGQLLHRRRGAGRRERLAADPERVSPAGPGALAEGRAEVEARRARSTRVPANLFKTHPDEGQS